MLDNNASLNYQSHLNWDFVKTNILTKIYFTYPCNNRAIKSLVINIINYEPTISNASSDLFMTLDLETGLFLRAERIQIKDKPVLQKYA